MVLMMAKLHLEGFCPSFGMGHTKLSRTPYMNYDLYPGPIAHIYTIIGDEKDFGLHGTY